MGCDSCKLQLDFTVGHFYAFYILEGNEKTAIIFEYRNASATQKKLSISKIPTLMIGSLSMTVNLLVKLMTCDDIEVLQRDHREMKIKADNGKKRMVLNWWRNQRGHYTKKPELNESKLLAKLRLNSELPLDKRGDGVYCPACMSKRNEQNYRNAKHQFKGFAEFDEE